MKRNIQVVRFIEKLEVMRDENFIEELKELRFELYKIHSKFLDYIEISNYIKKRKTYDKINDYLEQNKEYYLDLHKVVNSLYAFLENYNELNKDTDVTKYKRKEAYEKKYAEQKEVYINKVKEKRMKNKENEK